MSIKPTFGRLKVGVVQFPGSNCDDDCAHALTRYLAVETFKIWHQECSLPKVDALVIPGGFSYGDYLRSGALAARAPIMDPVKNFAAKGGAILGICNGFQILTESGLLPGALLQNVGLNFSCKMTTIKNNEGQIFHAPIAHGEGRYWIGEVDLKTIENQNRIAYRYCSPQGELDYQSNPNGSVANIAGVYSKNKKILGMMPHPERVTDILLSGSDDGIKILSDFLNHI